jgi:5-methylthioadenosine/S-adenosylhomocysteine deaminase
MCNRCDEAAVSSLSRRALLRGAVAVGAITTSAKLFGSTVFAQTAPPDIGTPRRRTVIRGGAVLSMDRGVGDFANADVLIEGKKILQVAPNIDAGDAAVIDAAGMIVMPGFIDTHHHQFETMLRSQLADALLLPDGSSAVDYIKVMGMVGPLYRPNDVYISELLGSLSQLDAGVTTVLDISQIHHSPEHTDAAVKALQDAGRRVLMAHSGDRKGQVGDVDRVQRQYFSSSDQLLTLAMGSEIGQPGWEISWNKGRALKLPIASHVVGVFGGRDAFDVMARQGQFGPDNIFIHMTGMSDVAWKAAKDAGSSVSLAVPIEMSMRHGMPPILKALEVGLQPSLSTDVECTMTADFFTQMRTTKALQRALVNQMAIEKKNDIPALLKSRDVIRFATVEGARTLGLADKVGTLTPGKEADIILLDANALNVAPLNNVPGAIVNLMERSNVDTVLVAGKIRKWKGKLLDVDISKLTTEIVASRDYLFNASGITRNLFANDKT